MRTDPSPQLISGKTGGGLSPLPEDKQPPIQRPPEIGFLIHDVSRLHRVYIDAELRPLGLTHSQCAVLITLSRHDDQALIQSELADAMDLGKSTLVGLLDRLEGKHYVARRPHPADRRNKYVILTGKGRELVTNIWNILIKVNHRIFLDSPALDVRRTETFLLQLKGQLISQRALQLTTSSCYEFDEKLD
jgi:DNA-binding MarR family transcriptional regulator